MRFTERETSLRPADRAETQGLAEVGILSNKLPEALKGADIPVSRINNLDLVDVLDGVLNLTMTLCPLYQVGPIESSRLLGMSDASIEASRVAKKWSLGTRVIEVVQEITQGEFDVRPIFTFADRGIISPADDPEIISVLDHHAEVYFQAITEEMLRLGIDSWEFYRYRELSPGFPLLFITGESLESGRPSELARRLAEDCRGRIAFDSTVFNFNTGTFNKRKGRKIVDSLFNAFGYGLTRDLLLQYGSFDAQTSLPDGLNFYFERGPLLLNVTNLFPHKHYPRIDVLS